jgi:hypothetical protein
MIGFLDYSNSFSIKPLINLSIKFTDFSGIFLLDPDLDKIKKNNILLMEY